MPPDVPPWSDSISFPDPADYTEAERYVAGALSTLPPFSAYHPAWCLPYAQMAVEALGTWEPNADTEALTLTDAEG
jgi:hypothetical protein